MIHSRIARLGVLTTALVVALPAFTFAGVAAKETKNVIEKAKESCITGDIGLDIYSKYIFHGLTLENQGAILQPYADLYFKLYSGEGALTDVTLNLGIWNSFHSHHTVTSSTRSWYEFDFLAGVSFTFAKNFVFTPTYVYYSSPGDYFETSHNLRLQLAYNDTDLLGKFALHPYFFVEFELDGKSGNGDDEGVYYEVGIAPAFEAGPVTVAFPIKAGFGSSDYYSDDSTYGFFSAGIALSYPLKCIPECLGQWTLTAGATYYNFGDPGDGADSVKGDNSNDVVFNGGLKVAF
jgi:hypothetical protein